MVSQPRSWEALRWFRLALQLQGSVVPMVLPRTFICALFGVLISILYELGLPLDLPALVVFVPNIVLGLMLVFRTNTAYERFWEGRKAWGSLVNDVRNLARLIWVAIEEQQPGDREEKVKALHLLPAFAVAMKQHLRQEFLPEEIQSLVSPQQLQRLKSLNHPPLQIAFWVGDYLQQQYETHRVEVYQLTIMVERLNSMVDALGACERILMTPMPLAYALHLKQLLLLYCLSLPFQMVQGLGWMTGPITGLVSFMLFGIEEIGIEIENPFGRDPNDLPLDVICGKMQHNITDLIHSNGFT
ncbi:MAG: bestrophin family ion channel [Thermostichus sp. DG02_5_bins_236]